MKTRRAVLRSIVLTSIARKTPWMLGLALSVVLSTALASPIRDDLAPRWISAWTTASIPVDGIKDGTPLADSTLRQVIRVTTSGTSLRLRLGNHFGTEALVLDGVRIALAKDNGAIEPGSSQVLHFSGSKTVSIPSRARLVSDPIELPITPGTDLAISLYFRRLPPQWTAHPGARATSYLVTGDALDATEFIKPTTFPRWYFIDGIEVLSRAPGAIAFLGDSITDGYGCKPDTNTRWPDFFSRRLTASGDQAPLAVLNLGIGGNRLLRDGLGPNILARFDRDVVTQPGVRWLVVFAGINDIGTRLDARKKEQPFASAAEIIAALDQIASRAKVHGIKVAGATITPYEGANSYWSDDGEADRQTVNQWIRESRQVDAVIDFDAALRDPSHPTRLDPRHDSGDHLHPSIDGYRALAEAVPLELFTIQTATLTPAAP